MATPVALYKFDEASSGTTPTTIADSAAGAANPITISAYATATWVAGAAGKALKSEDGLQATVAPSTVLQNLAGTKTASMVLAAEYYTNYHNSNGGGGIGLCTASSDDDFFDIQFDSAGSVIIPNIKVSGGTYFAPTVAWPTGLVGALAIVAVVLDTNLASQRAKTYLNGFVAGTDDTGAQNSTLTWGSGTKQLYVGDFPSGASTKLDDTGVGHLSIYATALTGADCLAHALRLYADNDSDPNAAGANLRAASTNGGTNDVSANNTDHSISFNVTIGASNNRRLVLPIAYFGVTTGVTTITFNGSATGVHLSAQQQSSTSGCDIYEILDADLPGAGTYTCTATVDGATGVACGTPVYLEGVAQSYATNTGLATGTGTSITATLGGSAAAGSILIGQLLDVSFGDSPVSGANQLPLVSQTTSSAIRQKADAKYVPTAGANSMSWSGLTTATGKVAVVIEAQTLAAAVADIGESAARRQLRQNAIYRMSPRSEREAQQFLRAQKRAYGFAAAA